MNRFYAHGKLLLTAEYMVMFGSTALAVPLKVGQALEVHHTDNRNRFSWEAYYDDKPWFTASFEPGSLKVIQSSDQAVAERLQSLFRAVIELQPSFQEDLFRRDVVTRLEFSPSYGFGSSSTLIALMAAWAEINPLELHFMVSEGSGYDVACAMVDGPILYKLRDQEPHYQPIRFQPPFRDKLYFAWLGNKQETASHLEGIADRLQPGYAAIHRFSQLTESMVEAETLHQFRELMEVHEEELSEILGMDRASRRVTGITGSVKSLGAWGGDFILIASEVPEEILREQLARRNIRVIYPYNELVYEEEDLPPDP